MVDIQGLLPAVPSSSGRTLLVIGNVPDKVARSFCAKAGMTRYLPISIGQACLDRSTVASVMRGSEEDQPANDETVRNYYLVLSGGESPAAIGVILVDLWSWADSGNLFTNSPTALFADRTTAVYHGPRSRRPRKFRAAGQAEPFIEVVRN